MHALVHLLFEARMLKSIPRSGYAFLGTGKESVAEHSFLVALIGYALAQTIPEADGEKLVAMCLLHDLPEARTGDLNYVQKIYVAADESRAIDHLTRDLPFGGAMAGLLAEFAENRTLEARLAHDADQIALLVDLKSLADVGYDSPDAWIAAVRGRITTEIGKEMAEEILRTPWNEWWLKNYVDSNKCTQ